MTKYYKVRHYRINVGEMKKRAKRRQILIKRIRCACGIIGVLAFMYILGITGGLEHDKITLTQYAYRGIIASAILILSAKIGLGIDGGIE